MYTKPFNKAWEVKISNSNPQPALTIRSDYLISKLHQTLDAVGEGCTLH